MLRERRSHGTFAHVLPTKGRDPYAVRRVVADLRVLGFKRVNLRTDQEPSILQLKEAVAQAWHGEVVPEESPVGESQSNGGAEAGVRSVEGMTRTLRAALEGRYSLTVHQSEHVMAWLVDHAATLLHRYGPGVDGKSPYHLLKGKPPSQPIAEFGETVMHRPHKGNKVAGKLNDRLREGVWLGINKSILARVSISSALPMES